MYSHYINYTFDYNPVEDSNKVIENINRPPKKIGLWVEYSEEDEMFRVSSLDELAGGERIESIRVPEPMMEKFIEICKGFVDNLD